MRSSRCIFGRGAAQVRDDAGEALDLVADVFDLASTEASERLWMMRPSCSVMEQKVQPQAAAHDVDAEADHVPGRDLGVAVGIGVRRARVRQVKETRSISGVVRGWAAG